MSHPLEQRLDSLRSRVRRLVTLHGLSWIVSTGIVVVVVLGLIDYLLRFEDRGIRVMATLTILGVLGWTAYRYLYLSLSARLRNVDLARRLQHRFPKLGDSLASAVEFLRQSDDDPVAGSFALRREVVSRVAAETEPLDFHDAIQHGPVARAAGVAIAISMAAIAIVLLQPTASRIAVARLLNPFGNVAWPQTTHLALREKIERVAQGQAFEIEVYDTQDVALPDDVRIHYQFEDPKGNTTEETEPMHYLDGAMVARRDNVVRPFSYRVEGGDDHSMPWIAVEVLQPPGLETLSIALAPPDYSGFPREKAVGHIRALAGTRVVMTAIADRPLRSAALCLEGGRKIAASLDEKGRTCTIPASNNPNNAFRIEESGAYWFELTDRQGLLGGSDARWEIVAVPDAPPTIILEQPSANIYVTPEAIVPLSLSIKDDLAIGRVALHYQRSDRPDEAETQIELQPEPKAVARPTAPFSKSTEPGDTRRVQSTWELAPLKLTPGMQITFHATAKDRKPQSGASQPRQILIITSEELADRLASRQAFILAELRRVLQMQTQSRSQVGVLEIQLAETARLDRLDVDHLRGAELGQRQVNRTLTSPTEGVPMHILGLLADLENNRIDAPDTQREMQDLLDQIDELGRRTLPVVRRELTAAIKASEVLLPDEPTENSTEKLPESTRPDPIVATSLATAGKHQDAAIEALEQMLERLSRWGSFRRFHREIGQLLRDQEDLSRQTTEIARRTLTKELKDLLPQDRADLKIAAQVQLELARRLDRILQAMDTAIREFNESDPLAAEMVSDALHRARELAIAGKMRSVGAGVQTNRLGQAVDQQEQIRRDLEEILDILANRREHELERLVKKLHDAQNDLKEMVQREDLLQRKMKQAAVEPNEAVRRRELERLQAEQAKLEAETQRMARRLERLLAEQASEVTQQAAEKMGQAGECAGKGQGEKAADEASRAKKDLDQAAKQLAERRRQAEAELAMEQLTQIEDTLIGLKQRQESVLEETLRIDALGQSQGRLTRGQSISLRDLAREQRLLAAESTGLMDKLSEARVFRLVLSKTQQSMNEAADLLDRRQTDRPVQQAEEGAITRLGQLVEAIQPEEPKPSDDDQGGGGQGEKKPPGMSPAAAMQALAELKLLKMMQQELNLRTLELDESVDPQKGPDAVALKEYKRIAIEQGRLADLLWNLMPQQEAPDDVPDDMPDDMPDEDENPIEPDEEITP